MDIVHKENNIKIKIENGADEEFSVEVMRRHNESPMTRMCNGARTYEMSIEDKIDSVELTCESVAK